MGRWKWETEVNKNFNRSHKILNIHTTWENTTTPRTVLWRKTHPPSWYRSIGHETIGFVEPHSFDRESGGMNDRPSRPMHRLRRLRQWRRKSSSRSSLAQNSHRRQSWGYAKPLQYVWGQDVDRFLKLGNFCIKLHTLCSIACKKGVMTGPIK